MLAAKSSIILPFGRVTNFLSRSSVNACLKQQKKANKLEMSNPRRPKRS